MYQRFIFRHDYVLCAVCMARVNAKVHTFPEKTNKKATFPFFFCKTFCKFQNKALTLHPHSAKGSLWRHILCRTLQWGLCYGVMVTLQVLVLSFQVRILVAQPTRKGIQGTLSVRRPQAFQDILFQRCHFFALFNGLVAQLVRATDS